MNVLKELEDWIKNDLPWPKVIVSVLVVSGGGYYSFVRFHNEAGIVYFAALRKPKWVVPYDNIFYIWMVAYPFLGFASCKGLYSRQLEYSEALVNNFSILTVLMWTWPFCVVKKCNLQMGTAVSSVVSALMTYCAYRFYDRSELAGCLMIPGLCASYYTTASCSTLLYYNYHKDQQKKKLL